MYYIYIYKNKINGKIYVGKTSNLERRKIEHLYRSKNNKQNNYFHNAIIKYGLDNFTYEIIYECQDELEAYQKEQYYIEMYKSNDRTIGYNSTIGGDGVRQMTEATKKKISDARKGKYLGEENPFYGKHHSEETKNTIALANLGNTYCLGKSLTDETKEKISIANLGKRYSINTEFKPGLLPPTARLTIEQAREIREKFKKGTSKEDLEKEYNLSKQIIYRVLTNRSYKENT